MNTEYRYILDKSSKKFLCPKCHKKRFVLYIDNETNKPLNSNVGKCDRLDNCNFHYSPKQYFNDNAIYKRPFIPIHTKAPEPKKSISFIDSNIFVKSLNCYQKNNLINYLISKFGTERINKLIETYFIGTAKNGGTIFWQIDTKNKIRTGRIITYHIDKPNRNKDISINWVHKALKLNDYNLQQCLFGEHLLNNDTRSVGIVESEKTALIASLFFPDYVWIASGGKQYFKLIANCKALKNRDVVLFPDLNAFDEWNERAKKLPFKVEVSDLLEKNATELDKNKGYDIADYLLNQN